MGFILRLAYTLTNNYMLSIFLFTLVMEILLIPFAVKNQKNQIRQANLAPKTAAIRKKYAGRTDQATQQKMQSEIMDMYQKEGYNPASGCGTLLIQLPIIMCLYNVVTRPLRYICNIPAEQIDALKNLLTEAGNTFGNYAEIEMINLIRGNVSDYSAVAPALDGAILPNFSIGPFDLSQTPTVTFIPFDWLMLIPVVTFIVMVASQKIMQKFTYQSLETAAQQNSMSMKIMMWTMPLMSVFFEFQMAAAIGVYWIFRNIISTAERIIIAKVMPLPKFTEEDYRAAEKQVGSKPSKSEKKNKTPVRSLHYIDDEDYIARHAHDNDEAEAEEAPVQTKLNGEAPAPIKNDEKSSYKNKKQSRK